MSELREAKRAGRGLLWSLWLGFALFSCQGPQAVGTNTNWMKLCDEDAECGTELSCECGRCTLACAESSTCPEGSSCSPSSAALLQCGGVQTATCQPTCSRSDECESGRLCLLGVCTDTLPPLDCEGGELYCEDFEQGLGEVTAVVTEGNTLTQEQTTTPSGQAAVAVSVSGGPSVAYVRSPLPTSSEGRLFLSGWVRVPEVEAHNVAPLALWASGDEGWALRLVITDAKVALWADTTPLTDSFQLEGDSWHCLQLEVDIAEAPEGSVAMSVDGAPIERADELDTLPDGGIDAVALGTLWAASAAELWVDRVLVSESPIDCFR